MHFPSSRPFFFGFSGISRWKRFHCTKLFVVIGFGKYANSSLPIRCAVTNVGAVINRPAVKCCDSTSVFGEFVTSCCRADDIRPYGVLSKTARGRLITAPTYSHEPRPASILKISHPHCPVRMFFLPNVSIFVILFLLWKRELIIMSAPKTR